MNRAVVRVRLLRVNLVSDPAGDAAAAGRLSPDWWTRALAPQERDLASAGRPARPAWAAVVERAVAAGALPAESPSLESWSGAVAVPLAPFLAAARDRLADGARRCLPPGYADLGLAGDAFATALGRRLARLAAPAMAAQLAAARAGHRLDGDGERERVADFVRRQCTPAGLAALVEAYPVLARLLADASVQAAEAALELLIRFAADRAALVETLLSGVDPGPVTAIEPGLGDRHQQGRTVTALSFADGRRVIYKPRSVQAHVWFGEVAAWLGERVPRAGLRTPAAVARPGYGWLEFIARRDLTRPGEATEFYRREGVLLAALYALHAGDVHCENLIASGDQPVMVDVETLFHPLLPSTLASPDPAIAALAASVHRTALLPYSAIADDGAADQSGMAGDTGPDYPGGVLDWDPSAGGQLRLGWQPGPSAGTRNRPGIDGEDIAPTGYEAAVLAGFRLGYDAIAGDRPAFRALLKSGADLEVRVVARPSSQYGRLLDEAADPARLRDARDRDEVLAALGPASAHDRVRQLLVPGEIADLWAGDIPLITSRAAAPDIWTSAGRRLPGLLDRTGLSCALDTVAGMGEVDRLDQEWVISASLACARPAGGHRSTQLTPGPVTATAAEPARLLAAACGLADQIVARGMTGPDPAGQSRVNWLGLQLVDDTQWLVLPMGAGLGDGYLGVALFLAQLARLTGVDRYAEVARRAVSALPQLWDVLRGRPELLAAVGCGGTEGLGGISYGLARMATLLDDAELRDWAAVAVGLTAAAAELPGPPGWAAGQAGCLAAMTAVGAELGSPAAARLAGDCADRLAQLAERTDGRCGSAGDVLPPGFAAGPAGIGWALTRFAASRADQDTANQDSADQDTADQGSADQGSARRNYAAAGRRAVLGAGTTPAAPAGREGSHGWCHGTAGLVIARTCLADDDGRGGPALVGVLDERPVLRDLSLCHGELGIAEALTVLAAADPGPAVARARRRRAGLILDALHRYASYCATPGGVATPGLLHGLAGVGYGLLRLGFAEQVPSALLLEPTPQ
jgi:type 2 lantibiotic biosynthesis protein LanM